MSKFINYLHNFDNKILKPFTPFIIALILAMDYGTFL